MGCKDWILGLLFFRLVSFSSALVKIHRLNGLVYYFLYLDRPLCESPAKKSATSHPLLTFLQLSVFQAVFLWFSLLSSFWCISTEKCVSQLIRRSILYVLCCPLGVFFFRTINHKLTCLRSRNVWLFKGFLRGNKNCATSERLERKIRRKNRKRDSEGQ